MGQVLTGEVFTTHTSMHVSEAIPFPLLPPKRNTGFIRIKKKDMSLIGVWMKSKMFPESGDASPGKTVAISSNAHLPEG